MGIGLKLVKSHPILTCNGFCCYSVWDLAYLYNAPLDSSHTIEQSVVLRSVVTSTDGISDSWFCIWLSSLLITLLTLVNSSFYNKVCVCCLIYSLSLTLHVFLTVSCVIVVNRVWNLVISFFYVNKYSVVLAGLKFVISRDSYMCWTKFIMCWFKGLSLS